MNRQSIGFRELLEQVLPLEQLPPLERFRIQRALHSGVAHELEAAARMAVERLEDLGTLRKMPTDGDAPGVVRYRNRDSSQVITWEQASASSEDGIVLQPRVGLPSRAPADLTQVRRLLHLEDIGLMSDPRSSQARAVLHNHLGQAGQELLGTPDVRLYPLPDAAGDGDDAPLAADVAREALARPSLLFYCPDVARSRRLSPLANQGVRSLALLTVVGTDQEPLGILEVRSLVTLAFQPEDLARIALLADYCGRMLERAARLEKLVFVDAMTGVYNRSYFELQARNEMARSVREGASSALCIIDIDDFKAINTSFGYEAGNAVLTHVASTLKRGVRPFDTVARWGGEEFVVLLSAPVESDDVQAVCERLRNAVERLELQVEGLDRRVHDVTVTVSVGVALFPEHGDSPQDLWRAANTALLVAKRPPKNKVVFHAAAV